MNSVWTGETYEVLDINGDTGHYGQMQDSINRTVAGVEDDHFYQYFPDAVNDSSGEVLAAAAQGARGHLAHTEHIFAGAFVTLTTMAAIIENGIVILIYRRTRRLKTATNMFLVSMCVCNLIEATLSFPLMASSSFAQRWLYGKIGCMLYAFVIFSLGLTGIFHLVIVAVDRYIVICTEQKVKKLSAIKGCVACWLSGVAWAVFPLAGWNGYIYERAHMSCCINWYSKDPRDLSYIVTIMISCLLVPMAVMFYSYWRIYLKIKNSHQSSECTVKSKTGKFSLRKRQRQTKMLKMIIAMTVAFLLSWSPYAVVSLWAAFDDLRHIPPTSDVIPALLAKASVIWNPIIYVAMNQQFREGFLEFIGRRQRRRHDGLNRCSRRRQTIINSNGSTSLSC